MTNPLVAVEEPDPLEAYEGAGIYSSAADVVAAARPAWTGEQSSPAELTAAFDGLTGELQDALEELGTSADPLAAAAKVFLLEPAVGWLIEHVSFLREPYDRLAGDPGQIKLNAETWHDIAGRLTEVAGERERAAAGTTAWAGDAGDAYRAAAARQVASLRATAGEARALAVEMMRSGALVGTVRAFIRDLIAELVARLVTWLVGALATAGPTGGATLATYVPVVITEGMSTMARIMAEVKELVAAMGAAARRFAELAGRAETALPDLLEGAVGAGGDPLRKAVAKAAEEVTGRAEDLYTEARKQSTQAEREQGDWPRARGEGAWVPLPVGAGTGPEGR